MDLSSQFSLYVCVCVCAVFVQLCGDAVKVGVTQRLRAGQHSCTGSFRAVCLTQTGASRLFSLSVSHERRSCQSPLTFNQPVQTHLQHLFCPVAGEWVRDKLLLLLLLLCLHFKTQCVCVRSLFLFFKSPSCPTRLNKSFICGYFFGSKEMRKQLRII